MSTPEPGWLGWNLGLTLKKIRALKGYTAVLPLDLLESNLKENHLPLHSPFAGHRQYVPI